MMIKTLNGFFFLRQGKVHEKARKKIWWKKNLCFLYIDVFVFNSIWFEFCFQIILDLILLHIWILKYILLKSIIWFMQLVNIINLEYLNNNMLTHKIKNKLVSKYYHFPTWWLLDSWSWFSKIQRPNLDTYPHFSFSLK